VDGAAAIYLAKAAESLLTAEGEFALGRYNSCANRCYYACFQAAIAALLGEGIRPRGPWGHDFVQGQFVGQLVNRRKLYSVDLRQVLASNRILRDQADYGPEHVTSTQANRALRRARMFVTAVQQRREMNQ
jgi:uncharacterized protein (UPF0332 family)